MSQETLGRHDTLGRLALERIAEQQPHVALPALRQVKFARRDDGPALHLGELAIIVRNEFRLADTLTDHEILQALQTVTAETSARDRWLALFNGPLGSAVSGQKRDLNTAIGFILAQLPVRQS